MTQIKAVIQPSTRGRWLLSHPSPTWPQTAARATLRSQLSVPSAIRMLRKR
jgi:hypothetical protein